MNPNDLTEFYTTKIKWIDEYMDLFGVDAFHTKHKSIIDICWGCMQNGDYFNIYNKCKDKSQLTWFVKFLSLFIIEGNSGYEFRNNYTEFHCINKRKYPLNTIFWMGREDKYPNLKYL